MQTGTVKFLVDHEGRDVGQPDDLGCGLLVDAAATGRACKADGAEGLTAPMDRGSRKRATPTWRNP
jgi:hypothetical protein